jgi:hypothetical protein
MTVVFLIGLALMATLPLPLRAAATELTLKPRDLQFGKVAVGHTRTVLLVVTNDGKSSVRISSVTSSSSKFKISKPKLPDVLAAGKRLEVHVTFAPTAAGWMGGHVTVLSNASDRRLTLPLGGIGEATESKPQLDIAPASLSFGDVGVGTTETLTLGLSASRGSVTISSVSSSSSQFAVPDVAFPLTIPAGHELSLNVAFKPQSSGHKSATLSFVSNAENSRASEPLSGTATALYVTLSWNASTSQVSGYNVYRGTSVKGTLTRINSSVDSDTSYTDATIIGGKTYYYATTAVNSSGKESGYSNRVEVVVP